MILLITPAGNVICFFAYLCLKGDDRLRLWSFVGYLTECARAVRQNKESDAFFPLLFSADALMHSVLSLKKHSDCDNDTSLQKSQWGHWAVFRRGTNHSAGVTILLNKFKGDALESFEDGLWLWVKCNNATFMIYLLSIITLFVLQALWSARETRIPAVKETKICTSSLEIMYHNYVHEGWWSYNNMHDKYFDNYHVSIASHSVLTYRQTQHTVHTVYSLSL